MLNNLYIKYFSTFVFFCFAQLLAAQNKFTLRIEADQSIEQLLPTFQKEQIYSDSTAALNYCRSVVSDLQKETYLEASFDEINQQDSLWLAQLHVGKSYTWATIKNGNVEPVFLAQVGFYERMFIDKPFHYSELAQLQESLLIYAENNGHPFAEVWLDSIAVNDGKISAQLFMKKNKLIFIEDIVVNTRSKISKNYLQNYLGLKPGSLYDKSKITKVRDRLNELPFLKEEQPLTITFKGDQATVNLFLDKKRASRFDFLLGLLPNSNSGNNPEVRRFLITGTFNADMYNQFGAGERLFAEFQQLRPGTQELDLRFSYPYILNLPFGIDSQFELYKRDSSYLDVIFDFGVQYLFEGGNYLKAFWNNSSSSLLNIDLESIKNSRKLPTTLDVGNSTFGLEYSLQKVDYRYNPRKGWTFFGRAGAGIKSIKPNSQIADIFDSSDPLFEFETLYDSLDLKTFQYQVETEVAYYLPIMKRSTIKAGLQAGFIFSEQSIYQNEQFRIGGNRLLRGFDEESIFATIFSVATLEYRFIIGRNSYLYAFGDFAYMEDKSVLRSLSDQPLGFGAGITFDTKVGVFGVSYALGRQLQNPIDVRAAKIHFGYVSLF